MAEFPAKLAIFGINLPKNAASLHEAARGGSPENLKTQGGILEIFDLRGGYFGYTPPWLSLNNTHLKIVYERVFFFLSL